MLELEKAWAWLTLNRFNSCIHDMFIGFQSLDFVNLGRDANTLVDLNILI